LSAYLDKCLDVIKFNFDKFCIHHIPRHENCQANNLVQGASGYNVQSKNFHVEAKPMLGREEILFRTEPDGSTATPASLTATQISQTPARVVRPPPRPVGPTEYKGAAARRSQDSNMLRKIGESQLLII
jgi:hypothetical protein